MYSIYLTEVLEDGTSHYAELDTEAIDVSTIYVLSELSDIAVRKDTVTKNIVFKGTPKNNTAFGSMFRIDRTVEIPLPEGRLYFNYTPMRMPDCLVYEDSVLILKGSMLLTSLPITGDNILYNTTITGTGIGLKGAIGDSLLTDLNLLDLRHNFTIQKAVDSWGEFEVLAADTYCNGIVYKYNATDPNTDLEVPFQKGHNYVYPYIEYGERIRYAPFDSNQQYVSVKMLQSAT